MYEQGKLSKQHIDVLVQALHEYAIASMFMRDTVGTELWCDNYHSVGIWNTPHYKHSYVNIEDIYKGVNWVKLKVETGLAVADSNEDWSNQMYIMYPWVLYKLADTYVYCSRNSHRWSKSISRKWITELQHQTAHDILAKAKFGVCESFWHSAPDTL